MISARLGALAICTALAGAAPVAAEQPAMSLDDFASQVGSDTSWKGGGLPPAMGARLTGKADAPRTESALDAFVRENGFGVGNIPVEMRLSERRMAMPVLCPVHGVDYVSIADLQQSQESALDPLAR